MYGAASGSAPGVEVEGDVIFVGTDVGDDVLIASVVEDAQGVPV